MEVRGWWEKPLAAPGAAAVPCRDATASSACVEHTIQSVDCETVVDPATGEPVRRCLKLYKRYLKCAGSPVKEEQQQETVVARGEGAEQLEPHLAELPSRLGGAPAPAAAGEPTGAAWMEDAAQSVDAFLRFAEALQEELEPGTMQLDHLPPAPARPYGTTGTGPSSQQHQQQQQQQVPLSQQQQQQLQQAAEQPFAWLGGLLRGKRRGEASGGTARRCIEPSTWREFEKDFTEV